MNLPYRLEDSVKKKNDSEISCIFVFDVEESVDLDWWVFKSFAKPRILKPHAQHLGLSINLCFLKVKMIIQ